MTIFQEKEKSTQRKRGKIELPKKENINEKRRIELLGECVIMHCPEKLIKIIS